jgi:hypothetical protein
VNVIDGRGRDARVRAGRHRRVLNGGRGRGGRVCEVANAGEWGTDGLRRLGGRDVWASTTAGASARERAETRARVGASRQQGHANAFNMSKGVIGDTREQGRRAVRRDATRAGVRHTRRLLVTERWRPVTTCDDGPWRVGSRGESHQTDRAPLPLWRWGVGTSDWLPLWRPRGGRLCRRVPRLRFYKVRDNGTIQYFLEVARIIA